MILSLDEAKKIHSTIKQSDLDAFETMIRKITRNNFHFTQVRFEDMSINSNGTIELNKDMPIGLFVGDTVEINYSRYNSALYVIKALEGKVITIDTTDKQIVEESRRDIMLTKVRYPENIISGVKKLIKYDKKMESKIGIKSESVSRVSTTYYDVNSSENINGYPSSLMSFLNGYMKMGF